MIFKTGITIQFFVPVLCILAAFSCSRYQYMSVNSYLPQNENKEFTVDNDTVLLRYSFEGEGLQIKITLYNKLRQPLFIDLNRSTVVMNNYQAESPFDPEENPGFIAPLSYTTVTSVPMTDQVIKINPKDTLVEKTSLNNVGKIYSYNIESTPVFFRVILALTTNDDYSYPTFFDYSFWVSEILQTSAGPKSVKYHPSDQFYVGKPTGFGKVAGWIGSFLILIITAVLLPSE